MSASGSLVFDAPNHTTHKSNRSLERDKPKHSRVEFGSTGHKERKNGGGSRGVWGRVGEEYDDKDELVDPNDPNYDEDANSVPNNP